MTGIKKTLKKLFVTFMAHLQKKENKKVKPF